MVQYLLHMPTYAAVQARLGVDSRVTAHAYPDAEVVPMSRAPQPPLVACLNSSQDLVDLMAEVLAYDGFRTVSFTSTHAQGVQPMLDFLQQHRPQVCVYAVSVPYRESWADFQALAQALPGCAWVLTTTNKRALDDLVGPSNAIEIIGKPYDIEQLTAAVCRALTVAA